MLKIKGRPDIDGVLLKFKNRGKANEDEQKAIVAYALVLEEYVRDDLDAYGDKGFNGKIAKDVRDDIEKRYHEKVKEFADGI